MKKIILPIFIILIVTILCTYLLLHKNSNTTNNQITEKTKINAKDTIEFDSTTYLYDIISIENGTIISKNKRIDTSTIKSQDITIKYKNEKNKTKQYKFTIEVKDTTSPITFINETYSITKSDNIDLCKKILFMDNYDKNPSCEITGEYDTNTVGEYNITIILTDKFNNVNSTDFTLKVKPESNQSYIPTPYNLKDLINDHKSNNTMIGVDVSSWQENINWEQVKNAGVEFAIIRIGFGYNKDGENVIDKTFENNLKGATEAGLKVGVYFYSYAENINEAKKQAEWVIKTLNGAHLDLPIAFDWEDWSDFKNYNYSIHDINEVAKSFMKTIEQNGYEAMIYGSKNYLTKVWNLPEYKTWLAHYTDKTTYEKSYQIWQLSSEGIVEGINGYVDLNVLYN